MKNSISGISNYLNTETFVERDDGTVLQRACKLYDTMIVVIDYGEGKLGLDNGGWDTPTTKKRMNEFLSANDLSYNVRQVDGDWYLYDVGERIKEFSNNGVTIDL
jgi:hypothetical protein